VGGVEVVDSAEDAARDDGDDDEARDDSGEDEDDDDDDAPVNGAADAERVVSARNSRPRLRGVRP